VRVIIRGDDDYYCSHYFDDYGGSRVDDHDRRSAHY